METIFYIVIAAGYYLLIELPRKKRQAEKRRQAEEAVTPKKRHDVEAPVIERPQPPKIQRNVRQNEAKVSEPTPPSDEAKVDTPTKTTQHPLASNLHNLAQVIVSKEILDPPLALRDK